MASNVFLDKINEQFEKSFSLCAVISKEMGCTAESLLAAKRVFSYKPDARPILELFPEFTPVIEKISNLIERYGKELEVDCTPQLWASLGYCYLYLGDFPNAFAAFAHALRLCPEPQDPVFLYGIGVAYAHFNYTDHAQNCLSKVLAKCPDFEYACDVMFRLAVLYRQRKDFDKARKYFENVLSNPPSGLTRADIQLQIGYTDQVAGNMASAGSIYQDLYERFPNSLQLIIQFARFAFLRATTSEDFARVSKMLEHGLQVHPMTPNLLLIAARIAMKMEDMTTAYQHYKFCIQYCSDNPYFWCGLGVLYFKNEQTGDAIVAFQRALYLKNEMPEAWLNIGLIYESQGDMENALKVYQTGLRKCPNTPDFNARISSISQHQRTGLKTSYQLIDVDDQKFINAPSEVFASDYLSAVPELPSRCFGIGDEADSFRMLTTFPQSYFK